MREFTAPPGKDYPEARTERLKLLFSGFDDNYAIEPLKQNVTVYLDVNNNGSLDPDEPNQVTRPNPSVAGLGATTYNYSPTTSNTKLSQRSR